MSTLNSLKAIYTDEIRDLWSANEQMARVVKTMAGKASDSKLKQTLERSVTAISQHANTLKDLLKDSAEPLSQQHCKGMEGLVAEATKHITKEPPQGEHLLDAVIVAQYQRMSHYGLAGFGTAAAYAEALGLKDQAKKLDDIVKDIYKGDEYASQLAERAEKAAAGAH
jgi:ferritin-like metal-binding protein YciE